MYTRCLVCGSPFAANELLEHLPHGDRVAFDPARGRLWIVRRACRRWSLTPIEARWEALEELERTVRDRARLLVETENIALLEYGPVELIRVGGAKREEEAWWRYGRELASRRRRWRTLGVAGSVAAGAMVVGGWAAMGVILAEGWFLVARGPEAVRNGARWLRFGSAAWRGDRSCPQCGARIRELRYRDRGSFRVLPAHDPGPALGVDLVARCPRCRSHTNGGLHLEGADADRALRRVLAYHHFAGASERRVGSAARLILEAGSPEELTRILVKDGRRLGDLQRTGGIALEIATNEAVESRLLRLELAELEAHWRREEELASIVDGELTPLPALELLRRRVSGGA